MVGRVIGSGLGFHGRLDHAARAVAVEGEDARRERAVVGAWLGSGLRVSVRVSVSVRVRVGVRVGVGVRVRVSVWVREKVRAAVGADAHAAVEVAADLDERREGLRDVLTVPQEVLVGLVRL